MPPELRNEWYISALDLYPNDPAARDRYCDEQFEKFKASKITTVDPWDCLRVFKVGNEPVTAIIRHPIKIEWVISQTPKQKSYRK